MKKKGLKLPKIEVLPSGTHRARATINGKVESFSAATDEEVISMYLLAKQNEKREPKPVKEEMKTLGDAMDDYIKSREVTKSPTTIRGYNIIRKNAFQNLMAIPLDKITRQQWQEAVDGDVRSGKSAKTIKNRCDLVRAIMAEYGMKPPKLSMPAVARSRDDTEDYVHFLDDAELDVFCDAIRGEKYELMAYLALNGLRRSELYGMTWDKINLKTKKITVLGAVVPDSDNQFVHKQTNKNATSTRTVPILFDRIVELVEEADKTKPITTLHPSNFFRYVNKVCEKNGLRQVGIHGLRHTGASLCVYRGVRKKAIMQWFGWSIPDTLDKIYSHISNRQLDMEAEKVRGSSTKPETTEG